MGKKVPPILLSGDHKKVDEWRLMMSLERTKERRPELYEAWMAAHPPKPPKRRRKRRKNTTAVDGTVDTTIDSIKDNNADNVEVVQNSGNTNFEDLSSNDLGK